MLHRPVCPQLQEVYKDENCLRREELFHKWHKFYTSPYGRDVRGLAYIERHTITDPKTFSEGTVTRDVGPSTSIRDDIWIGNIYVWQSRINFEQRYNLERDYYF